MVNSEGGPVDDQQVDLGTAWQQIVEDLQPNQRAWLRPSVPVTLHENTAIIAVPNDFTRNQLEGRLRNHIEDALTEGFGREIRMLVTVNPALEAEQQPQIDESTDLSVALSTNEPAADPTPPAALMDSHEPPASGERRSSVLETRLNPKYTFETFVIGSSNRFPHAAAVAVAEAPGKAYNPLLVYGDSGLGKTHLLHAIGHYALNLYTYVRVRYVNS